MPLPLAAGLALTIAMLVVGDDVVMSGRGPLNLTALKGPIFDLGTVHFVHPSFSSSLLGSVGGIDAYNGDITFPPTLIQARSFVGDGSGDQFGPVSAPCLRRRCGRLEWASFPLAPPM